MTKFIDLEKIKPIEFPSTEMDGLDVVRYLNTLSLVDAVEVVRCWECKFWDMCSIREAMAVSDWNAYCCRGERKTYG